VTRSRLPTIDIECRRCGHVNPCKGKAGGKRACQQCGHHVTVPVDRPLTEAEARTWRAEPDPPGQASTTRRLTGGPDPALVRAWARVPDWTDNDDAIMWRPDSKAGNCPECGRPAAADPGRTQVGCPACKWWGDYPEVIAWRDRQNGSASQAAAREPQLTQAELDAASRELHVRRGQVLAMIGKVLADDKLTVDCRSIFGWYQAQISRTVPGSTDESALRAAGERLDQLEEQLAGERVRHRGFWRRDTGPGDYLDDDEDQDDADDDEDQADAEPENAAPSHPRAIEPPPPCGSCGQRPAVARIATSSTLAESAVIECNVCAGCEASAALLAGVKVRVIRRYPGLAVRSTIKVDQLAAVNGSPR
jgi:hypothetical protein